MSARRARARPARATRATGSLPIGILGAGAAARSLAAGLCARGANVLVWARDATRARQLAKSIGARARAARTLEELAAASIVLVCVSDRAIDEAGERLARTVPDGKGRVALHTSGFRDARALAPLADAGWETGSLHPLLALTSERSRARLEGATFAVEGSPAARRAAQRLVRRLRGRALELDVSAKPSYHAAAALLAGGLVVLFESAEDLLERAGIDRALARPALARLAESVLANVSELGPQDALTGPAARGDADVVAGHLRVLSAASSENAALYRALVRRMLVLALASGALERPALARVRRSIGSRGGRAT